MIYNLFYLPVTYFGLIEWLISSNSFLIGFGLALVWTGHGLPHGLLWPLCRVFFWLFDISVVIPIFLSFWRFNRCLIVWLACQLFHWFDLAPVWTGHGIPQASCDLSIEVFFMTYYLWYLSYFFFTFPKLFFGSLNDWLAQLVLSLFWLCSSLDGTWPTTQPTVTSL